MKLRPHHLLCINFFVGKGYDKKFTQNMNNIINELRANQKSQVFLTCSKDSICECCPNLSGETCVTDEKVSAYDRRVLETCGLSPEHSYSFHYLAKSVDKNILSQNLLPRICKDCSWLSLCTNA